MSILDDAREGMNPDIRPQDDLFGHVNGRWLDTADIPSDRSSWGPFVELADTAEAQVHAIIEELTAEAPAVDTDAGKIAALYASFMDTERINAQGIRPIRAVLDALDGLRDVRDLAAFLGEVERVGGHGLFGSYVNTDARNSDRYLFHLAQGGLGLPDESYYREEQFAEIRAKYVDYLVRLLELAGGRHAEDARAAAERVLEMDTRLAAGHWERTETRDVQKTYNLRTAEELRTLAPAFDWDAYVRNLGGNEQTIAEVVVGQPSYFEHLSTVLGEFAIEDWKRWLLTRVLRSSAAYLSDEFVETNFDFYGRTLAGTPELRARWKRGVSLVEGVIGEAVGEQYVARHFPPRSKQLMDELVANLLAAYRHSITHLDWMTEGTKQRAFDKLDRFRPKIGYPDQFRDYTGLSVSPDDLIGNVAAGSAFETDRELAKIGAPVDRDEWFMLPQTVNAYYNPGTNEICFPAGILQKPFFSPDADAAENYGGIGAVIGHEIGHGFDDQGAQYDGEGNLSDWWTPDDKAAFEVKSTALIKQYDGFEPRDLPGGQVNGALTVGENIGDLGGLTIGHKAYLISLGEEPAPTVEDVTGSQRLFMSWAHCWRTKRRKELAEQYLKIDPHSPAEFRANIVRNLDEFHLAFGTREGDGLWLDPDERVRIW